MLVATVPETFAPATALAVVAVVANVAKGTSLTFAPAIADKFAPSPDTYVKTPPVPDTFPADTLPVTDNDDNEPTLVMFG